MLDDPQDESKFEKLYREYEKRVFAIAYHYTGDIYDSEEITQTTFFRVAKNIHKIDEENPFRTKSYIYTITKNAALSLLAKKKSAPILTESLGDFAERGTELGEQIEFKDEFDKVLHCIKSLPSIYRDVMMLFYLNELKIKEIASALDMNESTVKTHLVRGRKLLMKKLEEERIK